MIEGSGVHLPASVHTKSVTCSACDAGASCEAHELEDMCHECKALLHTHICKHTHTHTPAHQELEEMRHECTSLLREKFNLEQCVR